VRRSTTIAAVVLGSLLLFVRPALAEPCASSSCSPGADTPAVVIDGPEPVAQQARALPFAPSEDPTLVPVLGIAAGLALLGVTLTRICIRRRALMGATVSTVAVPAEVMLVAAGQTYLAGTQAGAYPQPEPAAHS
jgi:hypothetical protein